MFLYPDDYEGEEITLPAVPSIFASRRKGAPSSYWDGAHHEVKEGQSTQWLLDSGTTFHIIGIYEAMQRQYTLKPLPQPITFNTANAQAVASHVAEFPFPGTEHGLRAYVLPLCAPCLLSVCQLTIHEVFTWCCLPGKRPLLIRPDGKVIECFLKDGVPQIDLSSPQCEPLD